MIENEFKPTWLYVKKHNDTGLLYFGRTSSKDPIKYTGSGTWWRRHLKVYGNNVSTLWHQLYTTKEQIQEDAVSFSVSHNIVESPNWANLMIEDGINGSVKGQKRGPASAERRLKISLAKKGKPNGHLGKTHSIETKEKIRSAIIDKGPRSTQTREKISKGNTGKIVSEETRIKLSKSRQGRKCPKSQEHRLQISKTMREKPNLTCPWCGLISNSVSNMKGYHFDKCKIRGNNGF